MSTDYIYIYIALRYIERNSDPVFLRKVLLQRCSMAGIAFKITRKHTLLVIHNGITFTQFALSSHSVVACLTSADRK